MTTSGSTLRDDGIGLLRLAETFPPSLADAPDFAARYLATYYGDAQPLEGFRVPDPPVFVAVTGGAFATWAKDHAGEAATPVQQAETIRLAAGGQLTVDMIVAERRGVKSAAGVQVGDDWSAFSRAYPGIERERFPALWEEPSCIARSADLWFFFDSCAASAGKVIRMVLRSPG